MPIFSSTSRFASAVGLLRRFMYLALAAGLAGASGFASQLLVENRQVTLASLRDTTVTLSGRAELHLTGSGDPFPGCVVHLNSPDAWLFLRQIRPASFHSTYVGRIRIQGAAASTASNVRIVQHGMGTVVIPHGPAFTPLTISNGTRRSGDSRSLAVHTYHNNANLGTLAGNVRSFRLKRGYMATLARNEDGTGPSQVFIAQDDDIDVTEMPAALGHSIRFIRVLPWRWVAKKGWAGAGSDPASVDAAWFYNWNNNENSFLNREYVPIRQTRWWPAYDVTNAKQHVSHFLGFNEPDSPDQANMTVAQAIAEWPNLLRSGLRLGSPAPTDGGLAWLYQFMDQADALGYRVDFVAVHFYRGGQTADQLYNWLEQIHLRTGRPLWITEFNNGANWTCCAPSSHSQNATIVKSFLERMDAAPFVERYAIYNWLNGNREMIVNGSLTAAGTMYRDHQSPIGYRDAPPQRLAAVYDEQTLQANRVDQEMTYSNSTTWTTGIGQTLGAAQVVPLAEFQSRLSEAASRGFGGVADFERGTLHGGLLSGGQGFTAMFDDGRKSLDFTNHAGNGGSYAISGGLTNRTALSGERYLSRSGTADFDFSLGNPRGFIRRERVVAAGATLLGRNGVAGSHFFRFTAWYTNGTESGSTSLRRQINTSTGSASADTFAAVAAPPGHWITRVTITSENDAFVSIDDLAFLTSLEPEMLWAPAGGIGGSGVWEPQRLAWSTGERLFAWPGDRAAIFAANAGTIQVEGEIERVGDLVFEGPGYQFGGSGSLAFQPAASLRVPAGLTTFQSRLRGVPPQKIGTGTLVLAAANDFDPGPWNFGGTNVHHGHLRLAHPQALAGVAPLRLRGSQNTGVSGVELAGGHVFGTPLETWGRQDPAGAGFVLRNVSGNNTWNGDITLVEGGGSYGFVSDAGRLTLGGRITSNFAHATFGNRAVPFHGAGETRITGRLRNGSGGTNASLRLAISKHDAGLLSFAPGSETDVQSFAFHAGSLALDAPALFATAAMQIHAPMPLHVGGDVTFAFPIHGEGALQKTGPGTLTLAGNASHSGGTTVTQGTLRVEGAMDGGAVIIRPNATLRGGGSLPAATLQGTLLLEPGRTLRIDGALTVDNAALALTGTPAGTGPQILATYGSRSGLFATAAAAPPGWKLDENHANGTAIALVRAGYADWAASQLGGQPADQSFFQDGIPNLLRYALDLPHQALGAFPGSFSAGTLSFRKRPEAVANGDVSYLLESSPNLLPGSWTPVADAQETDESISYTVPAGAPRLFLRLQVRERLP